MESYYGFITVIAFLVLPFHDSFFILDTVENILNSLLISHYHVYYSPSNLIFSSFPFHFTDTSKVLS